MITKPARQRAVAVLTAMMLGASALAIGGCQALPAEALTLSPESLQNRQLQTRRFETSDEKTLLSASAALLQDLGYTLEESESPLGVIVASKDRDAVNPGQVIFALAIAVMGGGATPIDTNQKIRVSLVTRPIGEDGKQTAVRVTFQRVVWNNHGQVTTQALVNEPEIYQEFFVKLSKSVFLEAHEI